MSSKEALKEASIVAQNQKKVLKDQRRKNYADLLVQGTNDSSIVSKRSVEMLYNSIYDDVVPQFFQHFVKKPQRRSPAINRGYWIRMNAIKNCIDKIVESENCGTNVIVNLGCGYDPLPFQILDSKLKFLKKTKPGMKFLCIDIDYPELISLKVQMIKNSPELLEIVGDYDESQSIQGVQFRSLNYAAVGCNLRDLLLFQKQLTELGLHELNTCSMFVAEVSLAYMLPEHANPVITESSTFNKSHFIILEQLLPTNETRHPFGRTMLHHFTRLNTPLKCVPVYQTVSDQIARFQECGFPTVEARDLLGCWDELISEEEKSKVRSVEAFDEFEEFVFYTQHYIVLHATNSPKCCFQNENKLLDSTSLERETSLNLTYSSVTAPELLERKFMGAAVTKNDSIIMSCGSWQSRLNTSVVLSSEAEKLEIKQHQLPSRMCHTFTAIGNDEFILIGGRNAPHRLLKDCWKLKSQDGVFEWAKMADMPAERSRHSTAKINDHQLICFGGLLTKSSPFIIYDITRDEWKDVTISGDETSSMKSLAMTFNVATQTGYIVGGLTTENILSDVLFSFKVTGDSVIVKKEFQHELLQRYGAKTISVSPDSLLLVGGVSTNYALDQKSTIVTIDLKTQKLRSVFLNEELWRDGSMFVGFELLHFSDGSIVCVGGGAVCFGFGSFWNDKILTINGDQKMWNINAETTTV